MYIYNLYFDYNTKLKEKITLTQWKSDNHFKIECLYEPPVYVGIAGNLMQFLTTSSVNMIELTTEFGDDKKLHNIIKITDKARNIVIKNNKVTTVPTKLPMIVEPKPYKLKDGKIILGGYLKNDEYYNEDLFIEKVGYRDKTRLLEDNDVIDLINGVSSVPYKINTNTLKFIQTYGIDKGIILDFNSEELTNFHPNPSLKKWLKNE